MFPLLDEGNKKRLYRLNVVMKTYMNYSDKVVKELAYFEFSKVFDKNQSGRSVNRFLKHILHF